MVSRGYINPMLTANLKNHYYSTIMIVLPCGRQENEGFEQGSLSK